MTGVDDLTVFCTTSNSWGSNLEVVAMQGTLVQTAKGFVSFMTGSEAIQFLLATQLEDVTSDTIIVFRTMMFVILKLSETGQVFIENMKPDTVVDANMNHAMTVLQWRILDSPSQPNAKIDKPKLLMQYVEE